MNYLLDTHIFLWTVFSPKKLPKSIRDALVNVEATKYVSVISFWEISLKFAVGKIDLKGILPDKLPEIARNDGFEIINLEKDVASSFFKLPRIKNNDPFDRMIAWQAICTKFTLLTQDEGFSEYKSQNLKIVT